MPHIYLTILISASWSATSFSFLTGQVSLPCNILLCTQLLYRLPLIINDISLLVSNGTNCQNLFNSFRILASTAASPSGPGVLLVPAGLLQLTAVRHQQLPATPHAVGAERGCVPGNWHLTVWSCHTIAANAAVAALAAIRHWVTFKIMGLVHQLLADVVPPTVAKCRMSSVDHCDQAPITSKCCLYHAYTINSAWISYVTYCTISTFVALMIICCDVQTTNDWLLYWCKP